MYPKATNRQSGFLMPVAIFILVILAGVAITLTRFTAQSGTAVTQEAISVAAFYAAESGGQYAMNRLFYSTSATPNRTLVDGNCTSIHNSTINFTSSGLSGCSADLTCAISTNSPENTISFYRITSSGSCGVSPINAVRTVELASSLQGPI